MATDREGARSRWPPPGVPPAGRADPHRATRRARSTAARWRGDRRSALERLLEVTDRGRVAGQRLRLAEFADQNGAQLRRLAARSAPGAAAGRRTAALRRPALPERQPATPPRPPDHRPARRASGARRRSCCGRPPTRAAGRPGGGCRRAWPAGCSRSTARRSSGCTKRQRRRRREDLRRYQAGRPPVRRPPGRAPASVAAWRRVPVSSTATERARLVASPPSRASRATAACATESGRTASTRAALAGTGSTRSALELGDQLVQQERVAAAGIRAGRAERRVGVLAERRAHHARDRVLTERLRRDADGPGVAAQCRDHVRRRGVLALAGGQRDQHAELLAAGGQVGEEPQRGGVGPVGVVDGDHHRPAFGQVRGQPVQAVDEREREVGGRSPAATPVSADRAGSSGSWPPVGGSEVEQRAGQRGGAAQQRSRARPRRRGRAPPPAAAAPRRTRTPARARCTGPAGTASRASWASWRAASSSAVFPMPAGPSISTTLPVPAPAAATARCSRASCCSRSSSTTFPAPCDSAALCCPARVTRLCPRGESTSPHLPRNGRFYRWLRPGGSSNEAAGRTATRPLGLIRGCVR